MTKQTKGYCMASNKTGCQFVEIACLTCQNFCTTLERDIKTTEKLK